jgi:hypothetical protein
LIGILYKLTDKRILAVIPDVLEVTETDIKGQNHEVKEIDTSLAGIRVISPYAVNITKEDITQEIPAVEEIDGVPTQVMKTEVVGQREIVKIVLAEGGPEIGEGDTVDPVTLIDTRALLPKTKDQEIADLKARLQAAEVDNLNTMLALTEVYEIMIGGI